MVQVARYSGETTLNGIEWLLDEYDRVMDFENTDDAMRFLRENGYDDFSDEQMLDYFIFAEDKS